AAQPGVFQRTLRAKCRGRRRPIQEQRMTTWTWWIPRKTRRTSSSFIIRTMRAIDFQRALKVSAAAALLVAGGALPAKTPPSTPPKPETAQQPAPDKPIIAPTNQGTVIRRSSDIF